VELFDNIAKTLFYNDSIIISFSKKIPATTFEHYDTLHLHSNVPHLSFRDFAQKRGAPVL